MSVLKKASFFQKNKIFTLILLLQLLVILVLLLMAVRTPASTLTINPSHFSLSGQSNVRLEEDRLVFSPENDPVATVDNESATAVVTSYYYPLGYGSYEVMVRYTSHTTGNSRDFGATLQFRAEHLFEPETIRLYDNLTCVSSRLRLPFLDSWDDLLASITYHGTGEVTVESIQLTESVPYRFLRLLGFACLFVLLDCLYLGLFSNRFQLTEKRARWLLLSVVAFVSSLPFLNHFLYDGHDLLFHMQRISALAEELKNLQFPVRMFTSSNFGYGYPTPLYYCDIFLYLPALLYNCMLPLRTCYQIYVIGVNLATCVIAYLSFSAITGHKRSGLLGAALYTLCIYRLATLTLRSALGEYTAMAFLPLVALGMYRIYAAQKPGWRDWLPLSLGMACIIMSHVITTELVVLNLVLFCLVLIRRTLNLRRLLCIFKAAALCALLTVWFWLPFLQTYFSQEVNAQALDPYLLEYSGLYLVELFSIFTSGTGFSVLNGMQDSMPFTIGASLVAGLICIIVCVLRQDHETLGGQNRLLRPILLLAFANMFLTLQIFPWYRIQDALGFEKGGLGLFLGSIQHSWRLLGIVSVLLTLGTLLALQQIEKAHPLPGKCLAACLAAVVFVSAGSYLFEFTHNATESQFSAMDPQGYTHDSLYVPRGFNPDGVFFPAVKTDSSGVTIRNYRKDQGIAYLDVENGTDEAAAVTVPVFSSRHYQAEDATGLVFDLSTSTEGCVALALPPHYSGVIQIRYVEPELWHAAEWISLLTLAVLLAWWLAPLVLRRKSARLQSI